MNDILKQRLVGALILVALGVVFWPIIFVEPGQQPREEQPRIPPGPAVDTAPIEPPELAGLRPSEEVAAEREARATDLAWPVPAPSQEATGQGGPEQEKEPEASTNTETPVPAVASKEPPEAQRTRTQAPRKLEVDSDGVPVAWILQVASVSSSEKAEQLRSRLLAIDQKAYVQRVRRADKTLYRVYIGPKFERAALETMQPRVDAEFGVKSMIARYVP